MKLIKPSYQIIDQESGLEGIYKQIEIAARNCYKSEPVEGITSKDFVDKMIKRGHLSTLEHGTVYLWFWGYEHDSRASKYERNPYSKCLKVDHCEDTDSEMNQVYYITTNYRVLVENGWLDDLKYLCEPTEYHEKRVTVRFTTDRGVSHEFVRHRVFSFAQESTRYCNYSKDKFGNELTFIIPSWSKLAECSVIVDNLMSLDSLNRVSKEAETNWIQSLMSDEVNYLHMLEVGYTPQQARQVLPNALKTELVMTGFVSDWQHFFRLRTSIIAETGKPHPDASTLADPLYKEFIERGYMESLV